MPPRRICDREHKEQTYQTRTKDAKNILANHQDIQDIPRHISLEYERQKRKDTNAEHVTNHIRNNLSSLWYE